MLGSSLTTETWLGVGNVWNLGEGAVLEPNIWAPLFLQEAHTETSELCLFPEAKNVSSVHSLESRSLDTLQGLGNAASSHKTKL